METDNHPRKTPIMVVALIALALGASGTCARPALAESGGGQQTPSQIPPADDSKKPKAPTDSNPFPEDTNTVPVLPSKNTSATPASEPADNERVPLPGSDSDPVKSPDDSTTAPDASEGSSSNAGLDNLLKPPPDTEQQNKHRRGAGQEIEHPESAKEDESVGDYYLEQRNWKAARSRFESALVLDPENPDVYWGLAEAEKHLGDYARAKGNYMKVMEYDPDSRHGKDAKKILKEPEIENAKAASAPSGAAQH
jgi:hypothetical protein